MRVGRGEVEYPVQGLRTQWATEADVSKHVRRTFCTNHQITMNFKELPMQRQITIRATSLCEELSWLLVILGGVFSCQYVSTHNTGNLHSTIFQSPFSTSLIPNLTGGKRQQLKQHWLPSRSCYAIQKRRMLTSSRRSTATPEEPTAHASNHVQKMS